ncbi:hypothetical protein RF11_11937 [Thelohanellus kitauei]|uniref:Uncharacterized protein n=1 Tax=Thelohanellus kitauei TaxID=669202 RepID=A0A0C2MG42_THEKT|nr:hypothetical protein RF11_11937 [Thelohanellus kitauei]
MPAFVVISSNLSHNLIFRSLTTYLLTKFQPPVPYPRRIHLSIFVSTDYYSRREERRLTTMIWSHFDRFYVFLLRISERTETCDVLESVYHKYSLVGAMNPLPVYLVIKNERRKSLVPEE